MSALRGWGFAEQHLALDALVAFVDGELSPGAYDRAASHLAACPTCAAEADAQRQARSAVRTATTPSISPQLLSNLQSIPATAELPSQPEGLALAEDGTLVTVDRQRAATDPLRAVGSSTPLGQGANRLGADQESDLEHDQQRGQGRRAKQGAGVVFSGLVLGALAFMNAPTEQPRESVTTVPEPMPQGGVEEAGLTATASSVTESPDAEGRASRGTAEPDPAGGSAPRTTSPSSPVNSAAP